MTSLVRRGLLLTGSHLKANYSNVFLSKTFKINLLNNRHYLNIMDAEGLLEKARVNGGRLVGYKTLASNQKEKLTENDVFDEQFLMNDKTVDSKTGKVTKGPLVKSTLRENVQSGDFISVINKDNLQDAENGFFTFTSTGKYLVSCNVNHYVEGLSSVALLNVGLYEATGSTVVSYDSDPNYMVFPPNTKTAIKKDKENDIEYGLILETKEQALGSGSNIINAERTNITLSFSCIVDVQSTDTKYAILLNNLYKDPARTGINSWQWDLSNLMLSLTVLKL